MPDSGTYLALRLGKTGFALPSDRIEAVLTDFAMAAAPSENPWVYGVLYYDAALLPVIQMEENAPAGMVVVCGGRPTRAAYLASGVEGFFAVTREMLAGGADGGEPAAVRAVPLLTIDGKKVLFPDAAWWEDAT